MVISTEVMKTENYLEVYVYPTRPIDYFEKDQH